MLGHLTDILTTLITNLYVSTGLLGIIIAMAIESCCIPLPSEIVMPVAGLMIYNNKLLSGVNPSVSLFLVALAGALGCLIGSIVAYGIGYSGGRPLMLKYGRYVLISHHDADRADHFFQRWGAPTAFFSRLLPVIRTYISLPAGIAKMPFAKFCIYTFLGSFPWCLLLAYVGTIVGTNSATLSPIFHSLDVVILVVLVILVALYIWRHIRNDRKARAIHAASSPSANPLPTQHPFQQPQPQLPQPWMQPQYTRPTWNQQPQSPQPSVPPSPADSQLPSQPQPWRQPQRVQQQGWSQQPPTPPQQQSWAPIPQQPFPSQNNNHTDPSNPST